MKKTNCKRPEAANVRADSWAVRLSAEQQWELYEKSKEAGSWMQAVRWAAEQYGLNKAPSQSAFYRWKTVMQEQESLFRVEETANTAALATALSEAMPADDQTVDTFKALATEAALRGDDRKAASLLRSADLFINIVRKQVDLREHINTIDQCKIASIKLRPMLTKILNESMATSCDGTAGQKAGAQPQPKPGA